MNQKVYVLDSSVFIQAYRLYYAFDLVPSLWNTLLKLAEGGLYLRFLLFLILNNLQWKEQTRKFYYIMVYYDPLWSS